MAYHHVGKLALRPFPLLTCNVRNEANSLGCHWSPCTLEVTYRLSDQSCRRSWVRLRCKIRNFYRLSRTRVKLINFFLTILSWVRVLLRRNFFDTSRRSYCKTTNLKSRARKFTVGEEALLSHVAQHLPLHLLGSQSVLSEVEEGKWILKVEWFSLESVLPCQRRRTAAFQHRNSHLHQNNGPNNNNQSFSVKPIA